MFLGTAQIKTSDTTLWFASFSRVLLDKMAALDHLAQLAQEASLETSVSPDPRDPLLVDTKPDYKNLYSKHTL